MSHDQKNPWIAMSWSLLPGAGQLYTGEKQKGIALLILTIGVFISGIAFASITTLIVMTIVYFSILIPAALDARRSALGMPSTFTGDRVGYVIAMLCLVGPFALPLLWHSRKFSRPAKLSWTIFVIVIVVLGTMLLASLAQKIDLLKSSVEM